MPVQLEGRPGMGNILSFCRRDDPSISIIERSFDLPLAGPRFKPETRFESCERKTACDWGTADHQLKRNALPIQVYRRIRIFMFHGWPGPRPANAACEQRDGTVMSPVRPCYQRATSVPPIWTRLFFLLGFDVARLLGELRQLEVGCFLFRESSLQQFHSLVETELPADRAQAAV